MLAEIGHMSKRSLLHALFHEGKFKVNAIFSTPKFVPWQANDSKWISCLSEELPSERRLPGRRHPLKLELLKFLLVTILSCGFFTPKTVALEPLWTFQSPLGIVDSTPAVADLDHEGMQEVILTTTGGSVIVIDHQGKTNLDARCADPNQHLAHGGGSDGGSRARNIGFKSVR